MRRMIFRNSALSVIRAPLKSALFFLLIAALTLFLFLGMGLQLAGSELLAECDKNYTTIATLTYMGASYPDETVYDTEMAGDMADFDYSAIADDRNVLQWDPSGSMTALSTGYRKVSNQAPFANYGVLIVGNFAPMESMGVTMAIVNTSVYCYNDQSHMQVYLQYNYDQYGMSTDLYPFVPGHTYAVAGRFNYAEAGVRTFQIGLPADYILDQLGITDRSDPIQDVTGKIDAFVQDTGGRFMQLANYFKTQNDSLDVTVTDNLSGLYEFQQAQLSIQDGRAFTPEEYADGAKVCVITDMLASMINAKVGDTLPLRLMESPDSVAGGYAAVSPPEEEAEYQIVGIATSPTVMKGQVYIPGSQSLYPLARMTGYDIGVAQLRNGAGDAFLADVSPKMPSRVSINIYDQGYSQTANSINSVRSTATVIISISAVVGLAVLSLFALLFVYRQRETVDTMMMMGTRKGQTRAYLLWGAGFVAALACAAGTAAGYMASGQVNAAAFANVSAGANVAFSDEILGIVKPFAYTMPGIPVLAAVLTAAAVFVCALILMLLMARKTINKRMWQKKTRKLTRRSGGFMSCLAGSLRYALRSIRRGGGRVAAAPLMCLVMAAFIIVTAHMIGDYSKRIDTALETTPIDGRFTDYRGQSNQNLAITTDVVDVIAQSGYASDVNYYESYKYRYLGLLKSADAADDAPYNGLPNMVIPSDPFQRETFIDNMQQTSPDLIFTKYLDPLPEFMYVTGGALVTYLDGYDESFLNSPKPEWMSAQFSANGDSSYFLNTGTPMDCLVSDKFLSDNGLSLGDTIKIGWLFNGSSYAAGNMYLHIVGSFAQEASRPNIYCPEVFTGGVNGASFTVMAKDLDAFKTFLADNGFSYPGHISTVRAYILLSDKTFNHYLGDMQRHLNYLNILMPVLFLVVLGISAFVSYLLISARKGEFAIMKGLGTGGARSFLSLFIEQLILCLLGAAVALGGCAAIFGGVSASVLTNVGLFALVYLLGCTAAVLAFNGRSALKLLSEKE